ncbi:MAG: hypothetical protein AB7P04_03255 [Bacteriovoracia bacterium]
MFLKRVKWKNTTYYYLMRKVAQEERQEQLAVLGSVDDATSFKEEELIRGWILALMSGSEAGRHATLEMGKRVQKTKQNALGKNFDLNLCINEFRKAYRKHGHISKMLLEKTVRPSGELSWGTTTILNQLRNRGITLAQAFEMAKDHACHGARYPLKTAKEATDKHGRS